MKKIISYKRLRKSERRKKIRGETNECKTKGNELNGESKKKKI